MSGREVEPLDALSLWAGVHGVAVLFSRRAVEAAAPGTTPGADAPARALARLVDALVPAPGAR